MQKVERNSCVGGIHPIGAAEPLAVKQIFPELGEMKNANKEKPKCMPGCAPQSNQESIVATAESLVQLGY
jgi:hypothetical protein